MLRRVFLLALAGSSMGFAPGGIPSSRSVRAAVCGVGGVGVVRGGAMVLEGWACRAAHQQRGLL